MKGLRNFRFQVWTDGTWEMCAFRADHDPNVTGLSHVWIVLERDELEKLVKSSMYAVKDGYHHLSTCGDVWTFYDLDLPSQQDSGVYPVKFCNVDVPSFFARMLLRMAKKVWKQKKASGDTEKKEFSFTPEQLDKYLRLYGQGKGQVQVEASPETKAAITALLASDPNFKERYEYLQRIPRNTTRGFHQMAKLSIHVDSRDPNYFGWAAYRPNGQCTMNGALVKHSDGEWGTHT